ncbi:hypothetical protein OZN62_02395 [Aurantiacibacter sp. MUD11]|uniref:hypothetical protein n=1 Tax=Aurantiacibacter sp. MUD11 TaxID=3003265 RepID=UPI0022AAE90D|nr:hypothetical protein [Aurantiacibacter sp. MUD11]WAT18450.1 hypothetical protein OZN62_02395 [Aurantiacibacter sp. MUD11]
MNESGNTPSSAEAMEDLLRAELAQGDVILATARPILRHLLAHDEHALFSDEVIARIRGMMTSLARQLMLELAKTAAIGDRGAFADERQDELAVELMEDTALLGHAHALIIEAQMADRLQHRSGIDPVLSPLMQELAASNEQATAASAMRVVAAQARFMQQVRRMEVPLAELPAELFHKVTSLLDSHGAEHSAAAKETRKRLRKEFDEGDGRIGQITRLIMAMGKKAQRALAVDHAGLAIFTTALAMASEQDRNVVVLSLGENQCARLALTLRAAGLGPDAVTEQFLYLHPEVTLPEGFDSLRVERAIDLLGSTSLDMAN